MRRRPDAALRGFLEAYDPAVRRLYLSARAAVLDAAPDANELIYDAYNAVTTAYSFSESLGEAFCHVAAYRVYVNLGFNRGASLTDPERILVGKAARIRHVRIASAADLAKPALRALCHTGVRAADGCHANAERRERGRSQVARPADRRRSRQRAHARFVALHHPARPVPLDPARTPAVPAQVHDRAGRGAALQGRDPRRHQRRSVARCGPGRQLRRLSRSAARLGGLRRRRVHASRQPRRASSVRAGTGGDARGRDDHRAAEARSTRCRRR